MRKRNKMLIVILVLLLYVILKIYVIQTASLQDDSIPDVLLRLIT